MASPGGDTWKFYIAPHGPLKITMESDMWNPLVLPCGMLMSSSHMMMSATDISSIDVDVSPIDWPYLTTTLTMNIFQTITDPGGYRWLKIVF